MYGVRSTMKSGLLLYVLDLDAITTKIRCHIHNYSLYNVVSTVLHEKFQPPHFFKLIDHVLIH